MSYYEWKPYVSAAERRRKAEKAAAKARKKSGGEFSPVPASRGAIARTFWGKGWCDNLERYSDFANRLPRGRTYVRNGSVIDLQITRGEVRAKVVGSTLYEVDVTVDAVPAKQWQAISADCAGSIDSLVELLQGRLSNAVMERICRPRAGLFPAPNEIRFNCSCPDWASMCKHVAAVLYGVGARLDRQPELIFALRRVNPQDLVAHAGAGLRPSKSSPAPGNVLDSADLADVFGLDFADVTPAKPPAAPRAKSAVAGTTKAPARKPRNAAGRIGKARLAAMIEEATVDAYGEAEQAVGWYTALDAHVALPFDTTVLGVPVKVSRIDLRDDNSIVAICTRGRKRQSVPILELQLPSPKPAGAEWIEAYRHWVGVTT